MTRPSFDPAAAFEAIQALESVILPARINAPDAFLSRFVAPYLNAVCVRWIISSRKTNGREARLLMTGRIGIIPCVWIATCINAPSARLREAQIDQEVEWAKRERATQTLVFTTSSVPLGVRSYVDQSNRSLLGSMLLFGKREMYQMQEHPSALARLLLHAADRAVEAKAGRLRPV